ncbi:hypothetical protein [Nocardia sp. AB354]|uniref:hypothetical protein n=1 Tax=Nocardia sp. AB354 TaxID=3413283 RepID=UPI003C273909
MGLGNFFKGVGNFVSDHIGDIAVGVATGVGFALGGPIGAGLVGAAAGALQSGFEDGWSWENVGAGAAFGAVGGLLGGGVSGGAGVKGLLFAGKSLVKANALGDAEKAALAVGKKGLFRNTIPTRLGGAHLKSSRTYMGILGAATGPSTARQMWDQAHPKKFGDVPTIDIMGKNELAANA